MAFELFRRRAAPARLLPRPIRSRPPAHSLSARRILCTEGIALHDCCAWLMPFPGLAMTMTDNRRGRHPGNVCGRGLALAVALGAASCGGGGGGAVAPPGAPADHVRLRRVEYGRLCDVYGLQATPQGTVPVLFKKDVLIGVNITDQRENGSTLGDNDVSYDFQGSDPDTLQPRLLIPRAIGSPAFQLLFDALDDEVREITPMAFGQG